MHAPVVLDEGVIVYEKANVGVQQPASGTGPRGRGEGVLLRKNSVVETGAVVEAAEVGEGTVVEAGARVGIGSVIGKVFLLPSFCIAYLYAIT